MKNFGDRGSSLLHPVSKAFDLPHRFASLQKTTVSPRQKKATSKACAMWSFFAFKIS